MVTAVGCGRVDFDPRIDAPIDTRIDAVTACVPPYAMTSGGCYRVETTPASWLAAEAQCEAENAHLVVIADVAEHDVVHALTTGAGAARAWLGYTDRVAEGTFRWVAPPGVDPSPDPCFFGANPNTAGTDCVIQDGPSHCPDWTVEDCVATTSAYVCDRDLVAIDPTSY